MARSDSNSTPPHDPLEWGCNYWNCHLYRIKRRNVEVESPNLYHRGGFHPVLPGDLLGEGGRFRVVHKLGFGGFGTVWLCRDQQEHKWRALKILAAMVSDAEESVEMVLTKHFQKVKVSHQEMLEAHVLMPLEYFWIDGPNGKHQVQVLELLGPHLGEFFKFYARSRALVKEICYQLVDAMDFLHSHRICHGDFRPENIMMQLTSEIHDWTDDQLLGLVGKPEYVVVYRSKQTREDGSEFEIKWDAGVPEYLVPAANIDFGSGICSNDIAVSDFGVAYTFSRAPRYRTGIPLPFAAPESYFSVGDGLGPASDIWSLACTICFVATGRDPLFKVGSLNYAMNLEAYLGPMPQRFRKGLKSEGLFQDYDIEKEPETSYISMIGPREWYRGTMWEKKETPPKAPKSLSELSLFSSPSTLDITPKMAYQIALQDPWESGRLPTYSPSRRVLNQYLVDEHRAKFEWRDKEDVEQFAHLLSLMFKWDPQARAKTGDLVSHPWFNIDNVGDLHDFSEEEKAYFSSMGATAAGGIEPEALRRQRPGGKRSKQRGIQREKSKRRNSKNNKRRRRSTRRKH